MRIFFYALRDYDEKEYLEKCADKYGFEYDYTSEYPDINNLALAKDFEGLMKVNGKRVSGGLNKDAEGLEAVRDLARRSVKRN